MMLLPTDKNFNFFKSWLVVGFGGLFYCYQFIVRVIPNVIDKDMMAHFQIEGSEYGWICGFYYVGYASILIPLGIAMDRFGARRLMTFAGGVLAFSLYLFAATKNIYVASFARFLMGFGSSFGFVGALKLGSLWVPRTHFAKVVAFTILFGTLGACLGGAPLSFLVDAVGWQQALNMLAWGGLLISALILGFVGKPPHVNEEQDATTETQSLAYYIAGVKNLAASFHAWLVSFYGMLMYVPVTILGVHWGKGFVKSYYGDSISEALAVSVVSSMFLGSAFGAPVWAFMSDFLMRRKAPMLLGSLIACLLYVIIFYVPGIPLLLMYFLFFAAGFTYPAKSLTFASICEIMPLKYSGLSVSFCNTIVMLTGVIYNPIIGILIDYSWSGEVIGNEPQFSLGDYRLALSVLPISLLISFLIVPLMRETHPGRQPLRNVWANKK